MDEWMNHLILCFFPGSPYYYSATSRGAGPAATATASAYDRHWPLLPEKTGEWGEGDQGGMEGGTDSTSTAHYRQAYVRTTMRTKIPNW